jgi:glycosyltransferase involved in cell wall biosynthesis
VSVALATFNGGLHLGEQLASLAAQTLRPAEVVVGDDGSTDETLDVLAAFAASAPFPVQVQVNERTLGIADNFLQTARRCSSPLIAFCDQDDVWLPGKLERCAAALDAPGARLVIHATRVVDDRLRPLSRRFPALPAGDVAPPLASDPWLPVPGMAMVFGAGLLDVDFTVRPRAHHRHADQLLHDEWIYLLARSTGAIRFLHEELALYRQHAANETGSPGEGVADRLRRLRATGWDYFAARRGQAEDAARLLATLAAGAGDPGEAQRLAAAAQEYDHLAVELARRVRAYAPEAGRRQRLGAVARLAAGGFYRDGRAWRVKRLVRDLVAAGSRW